MLSKAKRSFLTVLVTIAVLTCPFYALMLTGCASTGDNLAAAGQFGVNATLLAGAVIEIEPQIDQAQDAIEANLDKFSATEQAQLLSAKASIQTARDTVDGIITGANGAAQVLVSLAQVETVYRNAKSAYTTVKPIIQAHEDDFTPPQMAQLQTLDNQAQQLDDAMTKLEDTTTADGVNVNQVLQLALTLAATGAKIAIAASA